VAIETAPAFVTTTVNGYTIRTTTTSTALSGTTNSLVSAIILPSADAIENKKIIMGLDIKVAFSDVQARLILQGSHNGTDWIDIASLSTDTTPNVTSPSGVRPYFVDLTDVYTPNFRLHFNSTTQNVGTSGTLQFFFAYK
jgi:hypothetical protein